MNEQDIKKKLVDLQIYQAFIENSHVSVWACKNNFEIVLWNKGAEEIYGFTKEEAIGKNYLELFVDAPEREESKKLCIETIERGLIQRNSLAYDKSKLGRTCYMLNNCFPIKNPETGEIYQAEVGVEISDLKLKQDEHRNLREVGIERLARKIEINEIVSKSVVADIDREITALYSESHRKKVEVDEWLRKSDPDGKNEILKKSSREQKNEIDKTYNKKIYRFQELKNKAIICRTKIELDDVRECLIEAIETDEEN